MRAFSLLVIFFFIAIFSIEAQIALPKFSDPQLIDSLNTPAEESFPVPYDDGSKMYFVRTDISSKGSRQQIWHTSIVDGKWAAAKKSQNGLNSQANNAVIGVSADTKNIYLFYSVHTPRKKQRGLAYTTKKEGEWSKIKKLKIPGFDIEGGLYSFYISPSEDYLLISMAPNDTSVNEDLFVSKKIDGEWQQAKSLGPQINTQGFEISPFLFSDDKTLYFSSNGHGGVGDADIFVSKRLDSTWQNWTQPVHLGEPINSPFFDAYFVIGTGNDVYFTSNRENNNSDIYKSELIGLHSLVENIEPKRKGEFVVNGKPAANVKLLIRDRNGKLIGEVTTDEEGKFNYEMLSADKTYTLELAEGQDESLNNGSIFILGEEGERKFVYQKLPNGKYELSEMELENEEGIFVFQGKPQANVKLEVIDENGNLIDIVYTDEEGKFNYQTLKGEETFLIRISEEDRSEFVDALLYVLDEEGNKTLRYEKLPFGIYSLLPIEIHESGELIEAIFKYRNLPYAGKPFVVYDENNFPIDTLYTNAQGEFSFRKLPSDDSYSIKPLGMDDEDYSDLTMSSAEESVSVNKEESSFVINRKTKKNNDFKFQDLPDYKLSQISIDTLKSGKHLIFYNFNEWTLTDESALKLSEIYQHLIADTSIEISLVGHTDSVGTEATNKQISIVRANAARVFLLQKGISDNRISIEGRGEQEPLLNNRTAANRAINRRVEVKIQ